MTLEQFIEEAQPLLLELHRLVEAVESLKSEGKYTPRPTEGITKASLETMKLIQAQERDCVKDCKERITTKFDSLKEKVNTIEENTRDLKRRIFSEVEGLGEASKTRNGHFASLEGRVNRLVDKMFNPEEGELDDRVVYLEAWIVEEEEKRAKALETSRFKVSTMLTIIGILIAVALGVANLVQNIIRG